MKWEPRHVLVVDDDDDALELAIRCVQAAWPRAEVISASSAAGAIKVIKSRRLDFVLTDVRMPPPGSGFDVTDVAQSVRLPCVAVSAHRIAIPNIPTIEKIEMTAARLLEAAEIARRG